MRTLHLIELLGLRRGSSRPRVVSQTVGNIGLNAGTLVLNFGIALLLSRLLGTEGFGAYAFAAAWATLLAVPALLGLPSVVVRELATYRVREDWNRARALIRRANQAVIAAAVGVSATVAVAFWVLDWPSGRLFEPTLLGLLLVPLLTIVSIRQCAMQGFGSVVLGRAPEALVAPTLTIVLVLAIENANDDGITPTWAVAGHVTAAALTALFGMYLLRRTLPGTVLEAEPRDEVRTWAVAAAPLLLMGGIQAVNGQIGTILTGAIAGSHDAGIYGVAVRVAGLLPFLLVAAVPPLMPAIAELHERRAPERLQRLLTRATAVVFVASLPIALGVIVFAEPILHAFGDDFGAGTAVLRILCVGQLVNLATGFAGMVLIMTGESGQLTKAVAVGAAVNLALSAVLIPAFGAEGAAISTAASVAVGNVLMAYLLWRRRRIYAPVLGLRRALSW